MHHAAPLPEFIYALWGGAAIVLLVFGGLVVRGTVNRNVSSFEAALTPFALPTAIMAFIALVVSGIGALLLATVSIASQYIPAPAEHGAEPVKWVTIPSVVVALALALAVLGICSWLAGKPEGGRSHGDGQHTH